MKASKPTRSPAGSEPVTDLLGEVSRAAATLTKSLRRASTKTSAAAFAAVVEGIKVLSTSLDRLNATVTELRDSESRELLQLDQTLRIRCESMGWRVDGQWPRLYVEKAVAVNVDERTHSVRVAGEKITPATADAIIATLAPIVKELVPQDFSPQAFLTTLATAYDDSRKLERGDQARVMDVYRAFVIRTQSERFWRDARGSNFAPITIDQFRARLTKALSAGTTAAPDGRELRLLPPLDPKDALFVYQPSESRFAFVGRIEFVPAAG